MATFPSEAKSFAELISENPGKIAFPQHGDKVVGYSGSDKIFFISVLAGLSSIEFGSQYLLGNIPVSSFNSGTNASASTFWSGLGTWVAPANAYTVVNTNSGNWQGTFTTVNTNSAGWGSGGDTTLGNSAYATVRNASANWDSSYSTTFTASASWGSVYTTINATSAKWNGSYTTANANSARWNSAYSIVNTNSASWGSGGDPTLGNSAYATVRSASANWNSTYSTLLTTSGSWRSSYTTINTSSAKWNNHYSTTNANSARWNNTFATVNTNSASWGSGGDTTLGNSAYATVNSNSASWGAGGGFWTTETVQLDLTGTGGGFGGLSAALIESTPSSGYARIYRNPRFVCYDMTNNIPYTKVSVTMPYGGPIDFTVINHGGNLYIGPDVEQVYLAYGYPAIGTIQFDNLTKYLSFSTAYAFGIPDGAIYRLTFVIDYADFAVANLT